MCSSFELQNFVANIGHKNYGSYGIQNCLAHTGYKNVRLYI